MTKLSTVETASTMRSARSLLKKAGLRSASSTTKKMQVMRWQVLKDGFPLAMASSPEEADALYLELDADEVKEVDGTLEQMPSVE